MSAIKWLCPSCEADTLFIQKCRICDGLGFITEVEYTCYLNSTRTITEKANHDILVLDLSEFNE